MKGDKCFLFNKKEFELFIKNFEERYEIYNDNVKKILISELKNSQHQINSSMVYISVESTTFNILVDWNKKEIQLIEEPIVWTIDDLIYIWTERGIDKIPDKIYITTPTEKDNMLFKDY